MVWNRAEVTIRNDQRDTSQSRYSYTIYNEQTLSRYVMVHTKGHHPESTGNFHANYTNACGEWLDRLMECVKSMTGGEG